MLALEDSSHGSGVRIQNTGHGIEGHALLGIGKTLEESKIGRAHV